MLIVGDFNLNVDKATATDFYNRLFFIMLEQFIDFPPRIKSHTLDLICTGITPFSSSALDLSIYLTINRSFSAHIAASQKIVPSRTISCVNFKNVDLSGFSNDVAVIGK